MSSTPSVTLRPLSAIASPVDIIRHFTPNWFAVTMGTGVLALALSRYPDAPMLSAVARDLWLINGGLFGLFSLLYLARWILFFKEACQIFDHPVMSMFLGCIPMGLATVINGFPAFGALYFAEAAMPLARMLWFADAALAMLVGIVVPFLMFTRQSHAMDSMTALWLLPIVASEVASVSGVLLLPHLPQAEQLSALLLSLVLWSLSVPLAFGILAILFLRMALHKLPPAGLAATSWLALGPIATGALMMILMYGEAPEVLRAAGFSSIADAFAAACLLCGVVLWGLGLWWLAMATLITLRYALKDGLPFNLGWWAYTFPLGVYCIATGRLAESVGVSALAWFGGALLVMLVAIWSVVALRTLFGAWRGNLFFAPCISATG